MQNMNEQDYWWNCREKSHKFQLLRILKHLRESHSSQLQFQQGCLFFLLLLLCVWPCHLSFLERVSYYLLLSECEETEDSGEKYL